MAVETSLKRGRPPKERNEVTSELLATGEATMAQLAHLFETDAKTLPKRLRGLRPSGQRHNTSTYKIREAAARLVKPGYSIEAYLRGMNHADLPPLLTKEYWNGQRARQIFEENAGDQWRTAEVVEALSEAFKTLRMELLLVPEGIERETSVTDVQRKILRRHIDGAIDSIRDAMVTRFNSYAPTTAPAFSYAPADPDGLESVGSGDGAYEAEDDAEDDQRL